MTDHPDYLKTLPKDIAAGLVVFLVALPLCLGIALASGAPILSGIVAGVVGGMLVAWLSGSHTSISGPAAGLTAVVATQIQALGSFEAFLVAVILAGALQLALGAIRAGSIAAFFPSSVINGLLVAIGIILILKQIPHLFGQDSDWLGDMSFQQLDGDNTFTEILDTITAIHPGATLIGLACLALLILWDRTPLKKSILPGPLVVVVLGVAMTIGLERAGGSWLVSGEHLVQIADGKGFAGFFAALPFPDFSALGNPAIAIAAITVAVVASLETLLNLEAVDKLDERKRVSPPNREFFAQGVGNITSGLLGGLPVTSVVVRSSVGINAGGQTRMTCFLHGALLLVFVLYLPHILNAIPLSCLAAVLMVTGFKLVKPTTFQRMWDEGPNQYLPFMGTIIAIVLTDLLVGIVVGLVIASLFILRGNFASPVRVVVERHAGGDLHRVVLSSQVTFLNRASLSGAFHSIPAESQAVIDARNTQHMDHDIVDLIRELEQEIAPARGIRLELVGFGDHARFEDRIEHVTPPTREVQARVTPPQVLELLMAGNERFATGNTILRDPVRQVGATASGQYPLAVVLGCIDSRVGPELIFDIGVGDAFSARTAGNVASRADLGSLEYACAVAGAKVLLVLGHTRCGAVTATVDHVAEGPGAPDGPSLENLSAIVDPISESVRAETETTSERNGRNEPFVNRVAVLNVRHTMQGIRERSSTLRRMIEEGQVLMAGGLYDVETGRVAFLDESAS